MNVPDLYQDVVASALAWYIVTTYILITVTSVRQHVFQRVAMGC